MLAKVEEVSGEKWRPFGTPKIGERDEAGTRLKSCRVAETGQSSEPGMRGKGTNQEDTLAVLSRF